LFSPELLHLNNFLFLVDSGIHFSELVSYSLQLLLLGSKFSEYLSHHEYNP